MRRTSMLLLPLLLAAPPLLAQEAEPEATVIEGEAPAVTDGEGAAGQPLLIRADDVEESPIYSLAGTYDQAFWDSGEPFGGIAAEWHEIGEVEDVILDQSGQVVGVTADVGGFLGLGEKPVLLPLSDIRLVQQPDDREFFVVTRMTEEQLEEQDALTTVWDD